MLCVDLIISALITRFLLYYNRPLEAISHTIDPEPPHFVSFLLKMILIIFLIIYGLEARVMQKRYTIIKSCSLISVLIGIWVCLKNMGMESSYFWSTMHIPFFIFIGISLSPHIVKNISQLGKAPEPDSEFSHKFIEVNGIRTHYVVEGEGYPIVLVHGLPETYYSWRKVIRPLAGHFRVYALDTIGYGFTDKPVSGYTVKRLAEHIIGFMDSLDLQRPVLVGHDWGGYIGWEIGVFSPEKIGRLVVINAPILRNRHAIHHRLFLIPGLYEFIGSFFSNLFFEKVYRSSCFEDLDRFNLKEYLYMRELFNIRGTYHSSAQYFHTINSQIRHLRKRKEIGVHVPTLYIWAEKDPRQPRDILVEEVQPYVHDLIIKTVHNSGHFLQSEQPEVLVEYLINYLKNERPLSSS